MRRVLFVYEELNGMRAYLVVAMLGYFALSVGFFWSAFGGVLPVGVSILATCGAAIVLFDGIGRLAALVSARLEHKQPGK